MVHTYYLKQLHKRVDKQLIITRLYMPIRLSVESMFIWHHICILIADEKNRILNLLVPLEGKQSKSLLNDKKKKTPSYSPCIV